ncbi:DUF2704 domain-containing protein [uncultured Dokdonia sp.]|uniref:DUF2704 domain-containing protein n=1 Tax=uncultured Dokdonia sp. TaxID=575653 RepID=UPI0026080F2A|nr:DUF2704 domain-containing protein [uncultured Dokdonia sp.]
MKNLIVLLVVFISMNSFHTNPSIENCSDAEIEAIIIEKFESLEKFALDEKSKEELNVIKEMILNSEYRFADCFYECWNEFVACTNNSLPIHQCMSAFRQCRSECPI